MQIDRKGLLTHIFPFRLMQNTSAILRSVTSKLFSQFVFFQSWVHTCSLCSIMANVIRLHFLWTGHVIITSHSHIGQFGQCKLCHLSTVSFRQHLHYILRTALRAFYHIFWLASFLSLFASIVWQVLMRLKTLAGHNTSVDLF